jgi:hypothetical protein
MQAVFVQVGCHTGRSIAGRFLVEFTGAAVVFARAVGALAGATALLLRLRYDAPPRPPAPRGVHLMADVAEGVRTTRGTASWRCLMGWTSPRHSPAVR